MGLKHLNEEQLNSLLKFERLVHHGCQVRLHDVVDAQGAPDRVALFLVPSGDGAICETVQTPAKAWIRQGLQNVPLSDAARDRLKRDRRVVDFERAACTRFDAREIDVGVLQEFKDSYLTASSYDWTDEELLYQVGAISREREPDAWTNAGALFFSANPQRVLPQAHIRKPIRAGLHHSSFSPTRSHAGRTPAPDFKTPCACRPASCRTSTRRAPRSTRW
jgi:predicted HTH transcriptional regulator